MAKSKKELQEEMCEFFDLAYKLGMRSAMVNTANTFIEDISIGKTIDIEYLKNFITFIQRVSYKECYQSYADYLQSEEWNKKATAAKERAGWRCQLCNTTGDQTSLHAHHRTYERLGYENDDDIIALCKKCHAKFHDKE